MELHQWFMANRVGETLLWKDSAERSIMFMRDELVKPFFITYDEGKKSPPQVISTHTSKSVKLPVVQFKYKGLTLTLRDNFYDWGFTVQSDVTLEFPDSDYIFKKDSVGSCREGFPDELMIDCYNTSDTKSFGGSCYSDYHIWTFVWLLRQAYDKSYGLSHYDQTNGQSISV